MPKAGKKSSTMAKVYFIEGIRTSRNESGDVWEAKNGLTRPLLVIKDEREVKPEFDGNEEESKYVYQLDGVALLLYKSPGGKVNIIILKTKNGHDPHVFGIFNSRGYGYKLVSGEALFESASVGGYGNSESNLCVFKQGAVVAAYSYKYGQPPTYWKLDAEDGWVRVEPEEVHPENVIEL